MPPLEGIGRSELEILRYVQDHHPIPTRDLALYLSETKGHTRTTALNVLERLRRKGHLTRAKIDGVYHYSPSQPKPQLMRSLVRDFVAGALGGSLEPFVAYLSEEAKVSDEELAELRQMVDQLEEQRNAGEKETAP